MSSPVDITPLFQALAWYSRHIDPHFVYHLTCGTVDSETSRSERRLIHKLFLIKRLKN